MKQQPQFKIQFYLNDETINLLMGKNGILIPAIIPKDKFEWWLRCNDKLSWQYTVSDHTGEPQEFNGTMSLDEYWTNNDIYITQDIYEYIKSNPINRDGIIYDNALESILATFDAHKNQMFNTRWEHDQEIFEQTIN